MWRTRNFDDLSLPFRVVATNIGTGQRVVLAIRASMSVPAVFAPVDPHRQSLIDGGISDNVPINVARFGYDHALGHDDRGTVLAGLRGLTE